MIPERKQKIYLEVFTYLYFLLFSLRNFKEIYIMCVELLDLLEIYRHLEF